MEVIFHLKNDACKRIRGCPFGGEGEGSNKPAFLAFCRGSGGMCEVNAKRVQGKREVRDTCERRRCFLRLANLRSPEQHT